jgi:hypothetical protein
MWNWKTMLSVPGSVAAGAFLGYVGQHAPGTTAPADWRPVLIGAAVAALIALVHLYTPTPAVQVKL